MGNAVCIVHTTPKSHVMVPGSGPPAILRAHPVDGFSTTQTCFLVQVGVVGDVVCTRKPGGKTRAQR